MPYKAEYIWIDGTEPTAKLRSKTKVVAEVADLPIWGFDGSSTNQAPGDQSDCVLQPVFSCPDPIRGGDNVLVLCEVLNTDMTPHPSNTRAACAEVASKFKDQEPIFGIEQEYTFFKGGRPYGFPAPNGFPAPQGGYYCGVGADEVYGRDVVEAHLDACLQAGLHISGINAEVMPGQWEFQVGPVSPPQVADELWIARWLLYRIAEDFGIAATLDPKPVNGDWNGADIEHRLTGMHETAPWNEFNYGVSNRGASVRIPWQVEVDKKGYIEDRRPNANVDPYVVTRLIVDTCCTELARR